MAMVLGPCSSDVVESLTGVLLFRSNLSTVFGSLKLCSTKVSKLKPEVKEVEPMQGERTQTRKLPFREATVETRPKINSLKDNPPLIRATKQRTIQYQLRCLIVRALCYY